LKPDPAEVISPRKEVNLEEYVRDLMTRSPIAVPEDTPLQNAARTMRDYDIGSVVVVSEFVGLVGIVTDRDIVVRALALSGDPATTTVGDICSDTLVTVSPDDHVETAVTIMRENGLRRLPVEQDGEAVGILSLGDLERKRQRGSMLAEISARPPNR